MINVQQELSKLRNMPYTIVPNFVFDEIKPRLSVYDYSVFDTIWRFLIGWNKLEDYISFNSLEKSTQLSENTIRKSLKRLESFNMIKTTHIVKNGFKHNFITLNINKETYQLPEQKQKLSSRVNNFFIGKRIETYNVKPIIINQLPRATSKLESNNNKSTTSCYEQVLPLQKENTASYDEQVTTSCYDDIKEININKNIKTYHKDIEKPELSKVISNQKSNDVMNVLKIESIKKEENNLEEVENYKTILVDEFGFFEGLANKIMKQYSMENIKINVEFVREEIELGKVKNAGACLRQKIENWNSETEIKKQTITSTPKPTSQVIDKTIQEKLINFFYKKRLIQTIDSYAIENSLKQLLNWSSDKNIMNQFKAIGLSKNDIKNLFDSVSYCRDFKASISKINDFLNNYESTEEVEKKVVEEVKEQPITQGFLRSALANALNKSSNFVEKTNNILKNSFSFDDNEVIPI